MGFENARSWMTFHANDVGALIKQFQDNGKAINLDNQLRTLQRAGQNYHVWLTGVNTDKLNRNCGHRKAMLVNLACSLIEHESIQTTTIRAKELRRFVERLITMAKAGGDHKRRLAYAKLKINTPSECAQTKKLVLAKLFDELGPRFADRQGGYTRII